MAWSCAAYGVTLVCVASENEENAKKRKPVKRAKRGKNTKRATTGETGKYERGTRSYTMSRIRGKDTKIEVLVRSYLFRRGLRFRKNDKRYPGHPDIVLPKYHVIVFVNGCFWHMHEHCGNHLMPKSNVEFWNAKLLRNRERDRDQHHRLLDDGWRVIDVWECELAKPVREERLERLYTQIVDSEESHIDETGDSRWVWDDEGNGGKNSGKTVE